MYFKYGNYQHPVGEVNFLSHQKMRRYSPRGGRYCQLSSMHIRATVIDQTSSTSLLATLTSLEAAYLRDGETAGLYYDDGTATLHVMTNTGTIDGVKVVQFNYLEDDGAEHNFKRVVDIVLQAEYLQIETELMRWKDTAAYQGTGGPRDTIIQTYNGPIRQRVALTTPKYVIQSGMAVGLTAIVLPPGPMFPSLELQDRRRIAYTTPERGVVNRINYHTSWQYVMVGDASLQLIPPPTR